VALSLLVHGSCPQYATISRFALRRYGAYALIRSREHCSIMEKYFTAWVWSPVCETVDLSGEKVNVVHGVVSNGGERG